jgi:hypothetical protein
VVRAGLRRARHRLVGADGRSARFTLEGEPLPLESDLVDACDPGRFLLKAARRNTEESDDRT